MQSGPSSPVLLTANGDFTITSTITDWPGCSTAVALMPGDERCLTYVVHNPRSVAIAVTSLSIVSVDAPATCPVSNLDLSQTAFTAPLSGTGSLSVAPGGIGTANVPIWLAETGMNQDPCQGTGFTFHYAGSAEFRQVLATTTALTSSANPVGGGRPLTLSATVLPVGTPPGPAAPGSDDLPTGTVTFYDGTAVIGSAGVDATHNTAVLTTSSLGLGVRTLKAVFTDTVAAPNFTGSTSNLVMQEVDQQIGACVGSTGGIVITGTVKGNYTVPPGASVWLNGGTMLGNVTVGTTGSFTATGGTVKGSVASSGGAVSLQGTKIGGGVSTTGASLGIDGGANVTNDVQVSGGGPVCLIGTTSLRVGGTLRIQGVPATATVVIGGTAVVGDLVYQGNGAPAVIGAAYGANSVGGNLTIQNNTGLLTIGTSGAGANTVKHNITVQSNTGGGTLTGNAATGSCQLQGNRPGVYGSANTAKGGNTCNRTA